MSIPPIGGADGLVAVQATPMTMTSPPPSPAMNGTLNGIAAQLGMSTMPVRGAFELDLAGRRIRIPRGAALDLGGIGKGWIADRAALAAPGRDGGHDGRRPREQLTELRERSGDEQIGQAGVVATVVQHLGQKVGIDQGQGGQIGRHRITRESAGHRRA